MVVLRGVARLHGDVPPQDYSELAAGVGTRAGFDPAPLQRVVRHVRGIEKLRKEEAGAVLAGYLTRMETLVAYLDRFTV
jgi:hypothetical protein